MDAAGAQEMQEFQAPQAHENHRWLAQLVGDWEGESEMTMGPDQPPMHSKGTVSYRMLGELWLIGDMGSPAPDGTSMDNIITLGYDTASERFQGSFVSAMMTRQWVYDGVRSGNTLTLDTVGPDMSAGCNPAAGAEVKLANYQDIIEIISPEVHTLRSQVKQPDGSWMQFMTCTYRRVK